MPGIPLVATACTATDGDDAGWICSVTVDDGGAQVTHHEVTVSPEELTRLAPGALDPTDLVERSFAFLLAREPASSILRSFSISTIGTYFPDYEASITG